MLSPPDPLLFPGVVLHALAGLSRALLLGGVLFLLLLVRPLAWLLGEDAARLHRDTARIAGWSAQALVLCTVAALLLHGADAARIRLAAGAGAAWLIALLLAVGRAPGVLLLALGAVVLAAALPAAHAGAPPALPAIVALHQLGAAIWIGGLPALVAALARPPGGWGVVAARFAPMAMLGGAALASSGAALAWLDVTGPQDGLAAFATTAAGVLVSAKTVLFLALLAFGAANLLMLRRLRRRPGLPPTRLRRFAEVEIGIGASLFFIAAALPSAAPAPDRLTWPQVAAYARPGWPRLSSPLRPPPAPAIVPASAADLTWSEATASWAGLGVLAIGFFAFLHRAGLRAARHWPLLLLPLAALLFARAGPAGWPLGPGTVADGFRASAAWPGRALALLLAGLGLIESRAQAFGAPRRGKAALLLPLAAVLAATALLMAGATAATPHQMLATLARAPLALLGIAAGWARWLDLRLDPYEARWAGWVWPACVVLAGLLLLAYPIA